MGTVVAVKPPVRYAVYCGDGVYVRKAYGRAKMLDERGQLFAGVDIGSEPVGMCRSAAVRACHIARAVGRGAWVVRVAVAAAGGAL